MVPNTLEGWIIILTFTGGVLAIVRRLILSELHSWKGEILRILNERFDEIEGKYVTKEVLELKIDIISVKQDRVSAEINRLGAIIGRRYEDRDKGQLG
jgi:hypothetical protein